MIQSGIPHYLMGTFSLCNQTLPIRSEESQFQILSKNVLYLRNFLFWKFVHIPNIFYSTIFSAYKLFGVIWYLGYREPPIPLPILAASMTSNIVEASV
jgi:hypothetical protein